MLRITSSLHKRNRRRPSKDLAAKSSVVTVSLGNIHFRNYDGTELSLLTAFHGGTSSVEVGFVCTGSAASPSVSAR